jgi:hypothetical protein
VCHVVDSWNPNFSFHDHDWPLRSDRAIVQVTPSLPPTLLYEGEWVKGNRHGKGTYTYPSGEVYSGDWYKNERHGQGKPAEMSVRFIYPYASDC